MRRALAAALLVLAACSKAPPDPAATPIGSDHIELVPAAEIQRGKDACAGYVERVCACAKTVPAAVEACSLARSEPEAIRISLEVTQTQDVARKDVIDAQRNIRKIVKSCVEETAKLPALGCPP